MLELEKDITDGIAYSLSSSETFHALSLESDFISEEMTKGWADWWEGATKAYIEMSHIANESMMKSIIHRRELKHVRKE